MLLTTLIAASTLALTAQQADFCRGFEEGYRSVAGGLSVPPPCPPAPPTAPGQTAFREGITEGIRAACRQYPNRC